MLILLLLPLVISGQWKTSSGSNKFDGSYKAATVIGTGGEFPNKTPMLVLNRFGDNKPSIYLTDIGYTGCDDNVVRFSFNGSNEIYTSSSTSINENKDVVFIDSFSEISMPDIIDLLKEKSTLHVRYTSSCMLNDYQFRLTGSNTAIKYVVGSYYDEQKLRINEENKKIESEQLAKSQKEETISNDLESSFECETPKKPIISSYVVFHHAPIFFDDQNVPHAVYLKHKDSLIIYNQLIKNRLLLRVKNADGKETEYFSTKSQLKKLIDNISEFYAIEYLYNNWDDITNRCGS